MEPINQPMQTQSNKFLVPLAIIVAGALVAGAIYFGGQAQVATGNAQVDVNDLKFPAVTSKDHILGPMDAEFTIIEYSDTECPFCKVFHNTMKEVMASYTDRMAWVYRQLPIPQLHSRAPKEAEATECVAELAGNSAFWTYLDKIFTTTGSNDSLDPALLPKFATDLGISEAAFNNCLSSGKYTEMVKKSAEEGFASGARGTPYSIIVTKSGKKATINGAEPIESVKAKIDALLK